MPKRPDEAARQSNSGEVEALRQYRDKESAPAYLFPSGGNTALQDTERHDEYGIQKTGTSSQMKRFLACPQEAWTTRTNTQS